MSMSTVSAYNGASYTDVLRKTIEENLSCIAIIDNHNKLCGIVDRDRFSAALVLSLIEAAEGKDVSGGQVGNMPVM
jgi:CBS-domain-containing membrane protein